MVRSEVVMSTVGLAREAYVEPEVLMMEGEEEERVEENGSDFICMKFEYPSWRGFVDDWFS